MVSIVPVEPWLTNESNKRSWLELNSPDNLEEDEDVRWKRDLTEAVNAIRDSDLDLDKDVHMILHRPGSLH